MQANTIRIDTWDTFFTMFTTLEPVDKRLAVLQAIADPKTTIGHSWGDCLFEVATRAVDRSAKKVNYDMAAKVLKIPKQWVIDGVTVWDGGEKDNKQSREAATEAFRNRIREHLVNLEKTREAAHV